MSYREPFKNRVVFALIISLMIILSSLVSVLFMLDPEYQSKVFFGMENFRYFTTLSNFLLAIVVILTVPFQVEGIRKHDYHLPRWIVNLLFFCVGNIAIVFLAALFLMGPSIGYDKVMFGKFNFWQHLVSPVLAMILFFLIDKDHSIKFKTTVFCIIPNIIYVFLYFIFVELLKDTPYAWPDVYHVTKFGHLEALMGVAVIFQFGVTNLVRVIHNIQHKRYNKALEEYYRSSEDFRDKTIDEIVKIIALNDKKRYVIGDIEIPVHILRYYTDLNGNKMSIDELCVLYTKYYFGETS